MRLLIPELERLKVKCNLTCFILYTVDEHTFKVVRNMRQTCKLERADKSMEIEHELINKLPKIELISWSNFS